MIIFLAFAGILTITFGIIAFVTSSSQAQRAVERRFASIAATGQEASLVQPEVGQLLKIEATGSFGWLNGLLQKYQLSQMLEARIMQANSKTSPAKVIVTSIALAAVGVAGVSVWIHLVIIQVCGGFFFGYAPLAVLSFKRSRRIKAVNAKLADAIDMMGRGLRAGHSITAAINIVAEQSGEPVRSEFSEVFKQQNFGLPLREALTQMLDRVPSQDLRVLVTGILVQKETGGNLAEILDRTAATIRERLRLEGEIRTHTAQGRLTGWILCALPIVMLVIINLLNPGYSNVLIDTPMGRKLSYIGMGMLAVGAIAIHKIVGGIEV